MRTLAIDVENLDATHRFGARLGGALRTGHVVALVGPLGSGKTMLVKGLAAGAGVADPRQVNSPSFVIVNEYAASAAGPFPRIYHIDAYRLRGSGDLEALGFDEMCGAGAVVVEWADRVEDLLPADRLAIVLEPMDEHRRRFHCTATGPASGDLLAALSAAGDFF